MKKSFFTWGKKSVKKLPESKDGKSTMQKINELRKLVESGKLTTKNRKKYQKLLDQFIALREKKNELLESQENLKDENEILH